MTATWLSGVLCEPSLRVPLSCSTKGLVLADFLLCSEVVVRQTGQRPRRIFLRLPRAQQPEKQFRAAGFEDLVLALRCHQQLSVLDTRVEKVPARMCS